MKTPPIDLNRISNIGAEFKRHNETLQRIEQDKLHREERNAGRFDAQEIYNYLLEKADRHQSLLTDDEELGVQLANFGVASEIHIREIDYQDPNLIEFVGVDRNGHTVTLIQHISQLNFLFVALRPVKEEPYRVGFREQLEENK